ncbi:MAG: hypothetical protein CEO40_172 [Parcubacteria group bacterium LiPW_72]|nr:MAG: hypothetical protein CEO40_172 [Parcubacteria group bacterium LiPW_72]
MVNSIIPAKKGDIKKISFTLTGIFFYIDLDPSHPPLGKGRKILTPPYQGGDGGGLFDP